MSSVKEGTESVECVKSDEIGSDKGKIEGIFGDDVMVDVVSGDKVDLGGKEGDGDVIKEVVESVEKVEVVVASGAGSVEVVKEVVVRESVVTTVVSGSDCGKIGEDKMAAETSSKEVKESVEEVVDGDNVPDEKDKKGTEGLSSSKISESTEGQVVIGGGLVGEGKDEDGVKIRSSSNKVVDAGTCEDNVNVSTENTEIQAGVDSKKESFQSEIETTTNDSQKSGNGTQVSDSNMVVGLDRGGTEETVERPAESVQEAANVDCVMSEKIEKNEMLDSATEVDEVITQEGLAGKDETQEERLAESVQEAANMDCVMSEKAGKDENLDSTKIPDLMIKVDEVIIEEGLSRKDEVQDAVSEDQSSFCLDKQGTVESTENLDQNAEVNQMNKEESSQLTIDVEMHDASKSGKETEIEDSKMDEEPEIVMGEIDVMDKGDGTELGSTKETLEQPVNSVQEVADGDHNSLKIQQSSMMVSLGLEEEDVVVVDEGLECNNKAEDRVSIEPSLVITTEVVNAGTGEVDQKAEVDSRGKDESSFATIKSDEVTIVQKEPNSDVQVSTDGGILVENKSIDVNAVTDSSKSDVVAYNEPESATDKMTPGVADKVVETYTGVQSSKVEPATISYHSSDIEAVQGLNANHSNQGNEVPATGGEHGVLPPNSEFSYEDAHLEREDDAGMDIDEVLGWKDEIPSVQEDGQKVESGQWKKTPVLLQQSCYFHPPEKEGEFSVSDLVWGKVRSHPWWPGQIFDSSDASEKAMKYHKKDCFLVAYFGDRTFGWNDSTVLKPFRENFSQVVEHMDSEAFNNAVHCALEEVSRRVELGLTCSCIPRDINENIKYQIVENSGIKQEASRRYGVDTSASVNSFEPDMLVDYVRLLAKFPHDAGDKMELTMAKAQLSSYGRFKGHRQLAEFQLCGDLLEVEHVVKEETYSEDGSKKRKALDPISDASGKRPNLVTETVTAKPSFKVGGSIQKVASQLAGPTEQVTTQLGNQADVLSQLHLAAQDPTKGIIQNHPEENLLQGNQNGGGEHHTMAYEQEKQPVKPARRSNKKRFFSSNHEIEAKEQSELMERRQKNLATEVLMKFTEGVYFPSEIHLNKMFRRFGPLMESETEVDRQGGRARVVFKKCSDAEVAHNSAGKFNIFGSINVIYELNYAPLISYKPLPLPLAQDPPNAC